MKNSPIVDNEQLTVFNGSRRKFFLYSGLSTKAFSTLPWNLLITVIVLIFLADFALVVFGFFSVPKTTDASAAVLILAIFFIITATLLSYGAYWDFLILAKRITKNTIMCEPDTLILGEDNLQLNFTVSEIVGFTNFKRNYGHTKIRRLTSSLDYSYVRYSYIISKKDMRNININNHLCTINGNSFLYLPKCFYENTDIKIDRYHEIMHDKYLSDEDRANRDEQYPWVIKKNKFPFVFAFKEKDAEQTLLEWCKK